MFKLAHSLTKFSDSDYCAGLTDNEIDILIEHFTRLEKELGVMARHYNSSFKSPHKAVHNDLQILSSWKRDREG